MIAPNGIYFRHKKPSFPLEIHAISGPRIGLKIFNVKLLANSANGVLRYSPSLDNYPKACPALIAQGLFLSVCVSAK